MYDAEAARHAGYSAQGEFQIRRTLCLYKIIDVHYKAVLFTNVVKYSLISCAQILVLLFSELFSTKLN